MFLCQQTKTFYSKKVTKALRSVHLYLFNKNFFFHLLHNVVHLYRHLCPFVRAPQISHQSLYKNGYMEHVAVSFTLCIVCHCVQAGASVWVQHASSTAGGCLWSPVPCPAFVLLWRSPSCPKVPDSTSR